MTSLICFSSGTIKFSSEHVEESATWKADDHNRELHVTWTDFSLPKTCEAKLLKINILKIEEASKTDFIMMSKDYFAQVKKICRRY